ncbi:MAG: DUF4332 domain-containing protein [Elainellaceae cyanobacterium]
MPSSWPIADLPGIDADICNALLAAGITTTEQLLQHQAPDRQRSLAARLRMNPQHLGKWIAMADLARIPAVGCHYCGLLLHSGIASPKQLGTTPIDRLHRQLVKLHVATVRVGQSSSRGGDRQDCPSLGDVKLWIQQARRLSPS